MPHTHTNRSGFALVIALGLMAFVLLLLLSITTLVQVETRSSQTQLHQMEAEQGALLGLQVALGELQKSMGPDQNISATAGILDTQPDSIKLDGLQHPYLTGIWQARNETLDQIPDYDQKQPFKKWLVSTRQPDKVEQQEFALNGVFEDPVILVGQTTAGADDDRVYAGRVPTPGGAFAWWVGDENCKGAMSPQDNNYRQSNLSIADLLASSMTPGSHGIKALEGYEDFPSNTDSTDRLVTRESLSLLAPDNTTPDEMFHHLSPYSQSVLANVTKGSLRKDLNLFLERSDVPWTSPWAKAEGNNSMPTAPSGPNEEIALSNPNEYDVLSWKSLHHWYSMHRQQLEDANELPLTAMSLLSPLDPVSNPGWNNGVIHIAPVLARMQMLLSYGVEKTTGPNAAGESEYELSMYSFPALTLWNPYNVAMKVDQWHVFLHTLPLEHTIKVNGELFLVDVPGNIDNTKYQWGWPDGHMKMGFGGQANTPSVYLKPGETKILTARSGQNQNARFYRMQTGARAWQPPSYVGGKHSLGTITGNDSDRITIETKSTEWETSGTSAGNFPTTFGFRCEQKGKHTGHDDRFLQQMFSGQVCWRREQGNPVTDVISEDNFPSKSLGELDDAPTPFIHLDVRLKTLDEVHLPNKTWLHNIPSEPYAAATSTKKHGSQGVDAATTFFAHPYTMSFEQKTTEEGLFQNVPFIGSSNTPSGQSRVVAHGIPMAPLTSLAQLQNLPQIPIERLNSNGYYMQNNAIGNSYASPGLAPTDIKENSFPFYLGQYLAGQGGDLASNTYPMNTHFINADYVIPHAPSAVIDRSYAANHLLFDDYFFSSMAAQEGIIFKKYGQEKSIRSLIEDFYTDGKPLPNAFYQPYLANQQSPDDLVNSLVSQAGEVLPDAHRLVAANLMVNGGFNINSTSVPAWTALLASSHLKRPVTMTGLEPESQLAGKFIVSRYGLTAGGAADNTNVQAAENKRWLGYRELTADEIRELATAIVKQVKMRGPFRSLAEFVNRRRSSDTDMALYGVLQAALEDSDVSINSNYRDNQITPADIQGTNYKFKEAALGPRYQGAPPYISQADILMPIAPIINARSDTFLIRAYGEARSSDGTKVLAKAWCEAVVQRVPDYIDSRDSADMAHDALTSEVNRQFGRKLRIKSFRWLSSEEINKS